MGIGMGGFPRKEVERGEVEKIAEKNNMISQFICAICLRRAFSSGNSIRNPYSPLPELMFVFWKDVWYIFHKVAKSNQGVFPARGHSKRKGVFHHEEADGAAAQPVYGADDGLRDGAGGGQDSECDGGRVWRRKRDGHAERGR